MSSKSTPTDLVSEADLASERAIRELLARRRPDDGFVGEEGGREEGSSGLSWVVDPLDGTINFLFGIPQWCVSVAVRDGAGTLAGAVYDPNRDELFSATQGRSPDARGPDGTIELGSPGRTTRCRRERAGASATRGWRRRWSPRGSPTTRDVRAAQARVLARLRPAGARHPPLRQRRAGSDVDRGRPLRRVLRARRSSSGTSPPAR